MRLSALPTKAQGTPASVPASAPASETPESMPESGAPESKAPESTAPESGSPESGPPESTTPESTPASAPLSMAPSGSSVALPEQPHTASTRNAAIDLTPTQLSPLSLQDRDRATCFANRPQAYAGFAATSRCIDGHRRCKLRPA